MGANTSSYSSSSGVYLGGASSGGGDGGGGFIGGEGFGRGGGGSGGSYHMSSVSKVRSSSSSGARRVQTDDLLPLFPERKTLSSRSGGYDGEILFMKNRPTELALVAPEREGWKREGSGCA